MEEIRGKFEQIRERLKALPQPCGDEAILSIVTSQSDEWNALLSKAEGKTPGEILDALKPLPLETDAAEQLYLIFLYSFMLKLSADGAYAEKLCQLACGPFFGKDQRLFLYHQLKRFYFTHAGASYAPTMQRLYDDVVKEWMRDLGNILRPIPEGERDPGKIVVVTLQFLGAAHAPTKTAMERIHTLGKLMGKEVICINSREQLTLKGVLPFCGISARDVAKEYDGVNIMQRGDYGFPLIQPEVEMPDEEMVRMLLEEIRNMAPWMVVVCGDKCLLGDLCARMIPTICIPMVFSSIPKKKHQYVAVGRTLSSLDKEKLAAKGYDPETVIESVFTFEPIPQTTTLTREALGLPKDKFLLGVIGIRLDADVTEEFVKIMLSCADAGIHLVFAGRFDRYEELCATLEGFRENSTFVGYQKDILALWDVLDLYVNPPRVGGGFSVAEAFSKGKPGISMNWGDVAASAGPDFCVGSLEDYPDLIRRYATDRDFYAVMSKKAVERSRRLFDSKGEMEKILAEAKMRKLWF
ncbi:MAG: glycosyltransferase [Lachnospiraceae bacterium]|nr:glycosyltransferase [Lachnospiraceae bacterium]